MQRLQWSGMLYHLTYALLQLVEVISEQEQEPIPSDRHIGDYL